MQDLAFNGLKQILKPWLKELPIVKNEPFDKTLQRAVTQLKEQSSPIDFNDFERNVWAEIALHDERWTSRMVRIFRDGPPLSVHAIAGSIACAIVLGTLTALTQADAYRQAQSAEMERSYVTMIHPVLRSEAGDHSHP